MKGRLDRLGARPPLHRIAGTGVADHRAGELSRGQLAAQADDVVPDLLRWESGSLPGLGRQVLGAERALGVGQQKGEQLGLTPGETYRATAVLDQTGSLVEADPAPQLTHAAAPELQTADESIAFALQQGHVGVADLPGRFGSEDLCGLPAPEQDRLFVRDQLRIDDQPAACVAGVSSVGVLTLDQAVRLDHRSGGLLQSYPAIDAIIIAYTRTVW